MSGVTILCISLSPIGTICFQTRIKKKWRRFLSVTKQRSCLTNYPMIWFEVSSLSHLCHLHRLYCHKRAHGQGWRLWHPRHCWLFDSWYWRLLLQRIFVLLSMMHRSWASHWIIFVENSTNYIKWLSNEFCFKHELTILLLRLPFDWRVVLQHNR